MRWLARPTTRAILKPLDGLTIRFHLCPYTETTHSTFIMSVANQARNAHTASIEE